ncbi:thiopeptide-type bacteriocin biosynthesis protein [Streptomyces sp. NPDC127098]|uniref:thiopeptide-type bacteriocin biosynthesis protein n=1 Tax=Streptomyces sp. NPDC127098 TaxID=3347137 RepID=UPI0036640022
MPADRLTPDSTDEQHGITLRNTEQAVLEVLTGTPLDAAASRADLAPTELATAVHLYQQAGRHALQQATDPTWWQLYLQFPHWHDAEQTAVQHLAPLLNRAEAAGHITAWWYIRKRPCWRLRLCIRPGADGEARIGTALDDLVTAGHIERWWTGIYEPETAAFGGETSMSCAHALFHADSRAILSLPHHTSPLGRRELSLLLCTTLIRAAGLEWYEAGDVWHRVAAERPLPADSPPERLHAMADDLKRVLLADTTTEGPMLGADAPLAFAADWVDSFRRIGEFLGTEARAGRLNRGLRQILAYHVIFHWNRIGLPPRTQSVLAAAASTTILNPPGGEVQR